MVRSLLLFSLLATAGLEARDATRVPSEPDASDRLDGIRLKAEVLALEKALGQHMDDAPYIVIDTVHNLLQVRQGDRVLREAVCATGSGKVLLNPRKEDWRFETPKGNFRVIRKVKDPIWAKPEWAFVEKGQAVPVLPWDFNRLDAVTLGRYALEIGEGYEIHGTLYPHLLGRHITHGCIRLNAHDLEAAFNLMRTGSHVYIY